MYYGDWYEIECFEIGCTAQLKYCESEGTEAAPTAGITA